VLSPKGKAIPRTARITWLLQGKHGLLF
ncbi:MAG: hypothetical protein FD161_4964, partial [Limisphaerales bacterium]